MSGFYAETTKSHSILEYSNANQPMVICVRAILWRACGWSVYGASYGALFQEMQILYWVSKDQGLFKGANSHTNHFYIERRTGGVSECHIVASS